MTTSLRPPEKRQLSLERSEQLREHLIQELSRIEDPRRGTSSNLRTREASSLRRLVTGLIVTAVAVSVVFFGLAPGDEPGAPPQIGQSSAKAAVEIIETSDTYEIVFVTLAEDVTEVEAELQALGLSIRIDFVPVSPSIENQLVVMSSPAEGENLPQFVGAEEGSVPPKLVVPKGFDQEASLVVGRPAQPGEAYVSAAISAQMTGEALECLSIEGKTASEALTQLGSVEVEIEWRPDLTDESFVGTVPDQYLDWYIGATVPMAQGRVLIILLPDATGFDGSSAIAADC